MILQVMFKSNLNAILSKQRQEKIIKQIGGVSRVKFWLAGFKVILFIICLLKLSLNWRLAMLYICKLFLFLSYLWDLGQKSRGLFRFLSFNFHVYFIIKPLLFGRANLLIWQNTFIKKIYSVSIFAELKCLKVTCTKHKFI